jgi:hypothetical protein
MELNENNKTVGEDLTFCNKWRKIGGEIWVDHRLSIGHVGRHVYRGSIAEG